MWDAHINSVNSVISTPSSREGDSFCPPGFDSRCVHFIHNKLLPFIEDSTSLDRRLGPRAWAGGSTSTLNINFQSNLPRYSLKIIYSLLKKIGGKYLPRYSQGNIYPDIPQNPIFPAKIKFVNIFVWGHTNISRAYKYINIFVYPGHTNILIYLYGGIQIY